MNNNKNIIQTIIENQKKCPGPITSMPNLYDFLKLHFFLDITQFPPAMNPTMKPGGQNQQLDQTSMMSPHAVHPHTGMEINSEEMVRKMMTLGKIGHAPLTTGAPITVLPPTSKSPLLERRAPDVGYKTNHTPILPRGDAKPNLLTPKMLSTQTNVHSHHSSNSHHLGGGGGGINNSNNSYVLSTNGMGNKSILEKEAEESMVDYFSKKVIQAPQISLKDQSTFYLQNFVRKLAECDEELNEIFSPVVINALLDPKNNIDEEKEAEDSISGIKNVKKEEEDKKTKDDDDDSHSSNCSSNQSTSSSEVTSDNNNTNEHDSHIKEEKVKKESDDNINNDNNDNNDNDNDNDNKNDNSDGNDSNGDD